MIHRRLLVVLALAASSLLVGCGGGDGGEKRSRPGTASTAAPVTTTAAGPTSTTAAGPTSTTATGCATTGGTADVRVEFPGKLSSLIGKDVRTGAQDCVDRFVIELQPDPANPTSAAFPGYWVRYASGPVTSSPSDEPVSLRGGAALLVTMGSPMTPMTGTTGYTGPRDVFPTNVSVILEYRLIEDFEGQSTWALGLDGTRDFTVKVLTNPARLVVDIRR